jgi:hypothetical protein
MEYDNPQPTNRGSEHCSLGLRTESIVFTNARASSAAAARFFLIATVSNVADVNMANK